MFDFNSEEWKKKLEKLSDLDSLRKGFQEFSQRDLETLSQEQIEKEFFKISSLLPFSDESIPFEDLNTKKIFRVRQQVNEETEDISLTSTFSYPPPFVCSKNGRANIKFSTVMYTAFDVQTAILELK
jgi:hypothetical protein